MPTRHTLPLVEFNKSKNFKTASNEYYKQSKYVFPYNVYDLTEGVYTSHNHDVIQNSSFDSNYFIEQKEFIESLTEVETSILASYTLYGDRLINNISRKIFNETNLFAYIKNIQNKEDFKYMFKNIFTKPLTKENCYSEVLRYIKLFQKLFEKVPPLKKAIRVFRGIYTDDNFDPRKQGIESPTYDFLSTTYDPYNSSLNNFTGKECCIMEFIIQPGVRALWIQPISYYKHEMEIVIQNNIRLYNGCRKIKSLMIDHTYNENTNENTNDDFRDIEVFEFEIKPYVSFIQSVTNTTRKILSKMCHVRGVTRKRSRTNKNSNNNNNNNNSRKKAIKTN
jgi:hypothetical protein